jgi:general secretion pathway protein G
MKNTHGFTMIEIMLVVIIIGILAAMIVPNFAGRGKQARIAAARVDIDTNIAMALDLYELDCGHYPTIDQGLSALFKKPEIAPVPANWNGPYIKKRKAPVDPWGAAYGYRFPGAHNTDGYDLWSNGPDTVESTDDIANWE